jgi:serine/threonine-protein kinase RsbW
MLIKSYQKIVNNDPNLIPEVNDFLLDILKTANIEKNILANLNLAISEGLSNAMVHGNKLDPKKSVIISLNWFNDRIEICIKDSGNGFNPDEVPDPTNPENLLKDSGRGIYIMRSFINEVKYNFTNSGTELILVISLI